eukprot:XP_015142568.1 dynein light chain 1, axonemal isoform X2 [Gallus gallus]
MRGVAFLLSVPEPKRGRRQPSGRARRRSRCRRSRAGGARQPLRRVPQCVAERPLRDFRAGPVRGGGALWSPGVAASVLGPPGPDVSAALRMRGRRPCHSNRSVNGSNGDGKSNNHQRSSSQMENLRILSLGRNNIKNLNGLEAVGDTLEELWISYNFIEKLRGIRVMKKLKVLYMSNNLVKDWEFARLAELPLLEDLVFVGNPLQEKYASDQKNNWIEEATKRVPKLKKLDGTLVIKQEEEEEGGN